MCSHVQVLILDFVTVIIIRICVVFYRNDLEVTDDFIKEFNDATDPSEKERLRCQSQKMLERIKVVIFKH